MVKKVIQWVKPILMATIILTIATLPLITTFDTTYSFKRQYDMGKFDAGLYHALVIVGFGNECIAYPLQREVELYKPEEFFRRLGEYHGYKDLGYYFAVDDVNGNVKYVDESSSFVIDNENGDVRFVSEFSLLEIERIMDIWAFCTTTNSITTNEL